MAGYYTRFPGIDSPRPLFAALFVVYHGRRRSLFSLHFTGRFSRIDTVMFSVRPRCNPSCSRNWLKLPPPPRARFGAKEEDWFPFSLSRRLMALVNHSSFTSIIVCRYRLWVLSSQSWRVRRISALSSLKTVDRRRRCRIVFLFNIRAGLIWTLDFSRAFTENFRWCATLNCSYHFFISTFVSVDAAPLRTNRFLTVVSCCNLTTLNIEGKEVTGEGSKEITTMVSNSNAFRFILIDFS